MKKELPDVKAFSVTNRKYIYASDLMELRERCGKLI